MKYHRLIGSVFSLMVYKIAGAYNYWQLRVNKITINKCLGQLLVPRECYKSICYHYHPILQVCIITIHTSNF